jgi:chromosome segregation ATPase
MKRELD